MEEYFKELCAPHFWPIVITIAVMLLLMGSGVALRPLLKQLINAGLKRLSGESVEVNINPGITGGPMAESSTVCEGCDLYKKCPMREAEKQRSLTNQKDIEKVDKRVDTLWEH